MAAHIHLGKNILSLRLLRGIKQEALADLMGVSQQAVSKLEQSEHIEDATLERVAKALGVTPEVIKNYDGEKMIMNIQNNYEHSKGELNGPNFNCTFNPLDKLMETVEKLTGAFEEIKKLNEESKKLYDALLKEKDEKIKILQDKT